MASSLLKQNKAYQYHRDRHYGSTFEATAPLTFMFFFLKKCVYSTLISYIVLTHLSINASWDSKALSKYHQNMVETQAMIYS